MKEKELKKLLGRSLADWSGKRGREESNMLTCQNGVCDGSLRRRGGEEELEDFLAAEEAGTKENR